MARSSGAPDSHKEMSFTVQKHLHCALDISEDEEVGYHLRQALQKMQILAREE